MNKFLAVATQTGAFELYLALVDLGIGSWILSPWWSTVQHMTTYRAMWQMAPGWIWGLVFVSVGLVQVFAIASDRLRWRGTLALIQCLLWGFVTGMLLVGRPRVTFIVMSPLHFLFSAFTTLKLGRIGR